MISLVTFLELYMCNSQAFEANGLVVGHMNISQVVGVLSQLWTFCRCDLLDPPNYSGGSLSHTE